MNTGRDNSSAASRVLVVGLGASGEAAARLLRAEGRDVVVADAGASPALQGRADVLRAQGMDVHLNAWAAPDGPFDEVVASPGIAPGSPLLRPWIERGIPVVSELELGWSRRPSGCRVAAVTGTNGKSTAVKLLAEALVRAGRRAVIGGNYGPPACRVVRELKSGDWLVLEVSSFQLETVRAFRPDIGILLNLQPNHLDRHETMEAYAAAKARLWACTTPEDVQIAPRTEFARWRNLAAGRGRWITFGPEEAADYQCREGIIRAGGRPAADLRGTYFDNSILSCAAAAVAAALGAAGAPGTALEQAARAFQPLPHRLQTVAVRRGVRYVDDSKATTVAAMMAGVSMSGPRVRLIAGGRAKESDFARAKDVLAANVAKVYLIGEAAEAMRDAWNDAAPCRMCGTLAAAVEAAGGEAQPGEVVLLSPACASFDQFRNFEERGDCFAVCANGITESKR